MYDAGDRGTIRGDPPVDPVDSARREGVPPSLPLARPLSLIDPHSLAVAPLMDGSALAVTSALSGTPVIAASPFTAPMMVIDVRDTGRGVAVPEAAPSLVLAVPSLAAPPSLGVPPSLAVPPSLGAPEERLRERGGGVPAALNAPDDLDRGLGGGGGGGGVASSMATPPVIMIPSPCEPDDRDSGRSGASLPLRRAEERESGLGVRSAGLASPELPELTEPEAEPGLETSGQISTRDREWPWMMRTGVSITREREWAWPERAGAAEGVVGISSTRERECAWRPRPTARPERCELELPWNVEKVLIFRESQSSGWNGGRTAGLHGTLTEKEGARRGVDREWRVHETKDGQIKPK